MRVLLAFDKFKDALSSTEACVVAARALALSHPDWELDLCPMTDGGEGFCEILTRAAGGELAVLSVTGPRGAPVSAPLGFARFRDIPSAAKTLLSLSAPPRIHADPEAKVAIIEMSTASGLALLPSGQRDVWQATTFGTGELIRAAAERNVAAIVLGIGGSATNDLGLGALAALGLEFLPAAGQPLRPPIPAHWEKIARIAGKIRAGLPPIYIACDVNNPLLGPRGAAAVYGPQKGLQPADRPRLEHAAARLALLLCHHSGQPDSLMDTPGTGAAGGISFGLMAGAGARLLSGFDLVNAWLGVEQRLAEADVVITGEGRFDESSLEGKGPGAVVRRALALGKRLHVFAGECSAPTLPPGLSMHAVTPPGAPLDRALRDTAENLTRAMAALP